MSESDQRSGRRGLPRDTAEFRATPDVAASTAQFQAFARGYDSKPAEPRAAQSWPQQPDPGHPVRRGSGVSPAMIVGAVAGIAVLVVAVILLFG